jgi:Tol biopolymer transport system component
MTVTPALFGRALLALVLAAVAAGLIAPTGAKPTKAAFPGANGKIAFASSRITSTGVDNPEGDSEILTMKPDGTGLEQLTDNAANDYDPAWSAQGDAIAFVSQRDNQNEEVYMMDADADPQTRLTNNAANDTNPTFSPNGNRIAFTSNRGPAANSDIWVMDAVDSDNDGNGDNLVRFTTDAAFDSSPAWSPDGSKIAFESGRDDPQGEIYVMDAAPESPANQPVRLTADAAGDFHPNWSPDGSKIAFTRNREGNRDIYLVNALDGSGQKRLTKKAALDTDPAWSPDGTKIAFWSERGGGDREVYVMKAKPESRKNRPKNITKSNLPDTDPDWQPAP